ncbi:hypothetical protein L861_23945 [Litchfieldella anticariensis FP35 = DSM 16096]|uniref:Lipoprotein n=1 Tax=Litchfieldella anticariensis (strain DSM 16096 / CECT 5854 / CIP 108499 / LMG 22089 / FP35) TaxID=1121939 RepID=S2KL61_LITA3|nr:hypothetical protein [Halomonas anticariensis]EPC02867.1 hypothetical protein L861_23945 [Halomonas anticariensis FP35 = DSM 16096]
MILRGLLLSGILLILTACATTSAPVAPRSMIMAANPQEVLREGIAMLAERGYVIRHADTDLGRAEAVSATWPGYEILLQVESEGEDSWVSFSGRRGTQPLAPYSLDPLLVDLQARLGLAP